MVETELKNPCAEKKDFCVNCHSHFMTVRPLLRSVVISRHFLRDLKNETAVKSIVRNVLDCSNSDFAEMHKFEENVEGNLIFRAKKEGTHIVYGVDKQLRIVFLRAFKNYSEYGKFLEDKSEIIRMMTHS